MEGSGRDQYAGRNNRKMYKNKKLPEVARHNLPRGSRDDGAPVVLETGAAASTSVAETPTGASLPSSDTRAEEGTTIADDGSIYCSLCDMWVNGQEQYDLHRNGKEHNNNMAPPHRPQGAMPVAKDASANESLREITDAYRDRRRCDDVRDPELYLESTSLTLVAARPQDRREIVPGGLEHETVGRSEDASVAAKVLFLVLGCIRAGTMEIIVFGRHLLATRHDIALLRGGLTGMVSRLPSAISGVVVRFIRDSATTTRELRLGVDYTGTMIALTPASPFRATVVGFAARHFKNHRLLRIGSDL